MFRKLNLDWQVGDFTYGDKIVEFGSRFVDSKLVPQIAYHVAHGECENLLDKLIPERYLKDFRVAVMDISSGVGPHTDSEILVTINHYFQTNDELTIFYSFKPDVEITTKQIKNQTNGLVFNPSQLNVHSAFTAKENETWVLDVTQPHSVRAITPSTRFRRAVVVNTTVYTYEQVLEMLEEQRVL